MFGSSDAELTPAQQDLRTESERFKWTRLQGALLGAASGALAGWLISEDATGAAIGAAAGGALGYAAGYYIDTVNQSYANEQQALSTRVDAANQDIARYERAVADARTVVGSHRQTIADLNAQYARQQITADQYGAQVASIEGDIEALQDLINESSGNVELMDKDIAQLREQGANVGGLVARRNELAGKRDALQEQLDTLASAIGSIPDEVGGPVIS
jgi:chromosome segregation ATPase